MPDLRLGHCTEDDTLRRVCCYEIRSATSAKHIVAACTLWVWIDRTTGRPRPMPRAILDAYAVKTGTPDQRDS